MNTFPAVLTLIADFGLVCTQRVYIVLKGAHVAQARNLSSMHAPMFGLRGCLNFLARIVSSTARFMQLSTPNL